MAQDPSGSPIGGLTIPRVSLPGRFTAEQSIRFSTALVQSIFRPLGIDFGEDSTIEEIIARIISLIKSFYIINPRNNRQRKRSRKAIKIVARLKASLPRVYGQLLRQETTLIELIMAEHIQYLVSETGQKIDSLRGNNKRIFQILRRVESEYPDVLEIIRHTRGEIIEQYEYSRNGEHKAKSQRSSIPEIAAICNHNNQVVKPEDLRIIPCDVEFIVSSGVMHYRKVQNDIRSLAGDKHPYRALSPEIQAYKRTRRVDKAYRIENCSLGKVTKEPVRRFSHRAYQDKDPNNTVGEFVELTLCALSQQIDEYPEKEYILVVFQAIKDSLVAHRFKVIRNCTTFYVV